MGVAVAQRSALTDEALERQLAIAQLTALVLGDRA